MTRSYTTTRPVRPRIARHCAWRPIATLSRNRFDRAPSRECNSGASKSPKRTSIQVEGSLSAPTQRLSPSPTYRTKPLNSVPARDGRRAVHGSANATHGASAQTAKTSIDQTHFMMHPSLVFEAFFDSISNAIVRRCDHPCLSCSIRDDGELALHNRTQSPHLAFSQLRVYARKSRRTTRRVELHNHPSGDPNPSPADVAITREIVTATRAVSVKVHDHLVVGRNGVASFKSLGLL